MFAAFIGLLITGGWVINKQYRHFEALKSLDRNGYPPELYGYQTQLKVLRLKRPINTQDLTWFRCGKLEVFELKDLNTLYWMEGLSVLRQCNSRIIIKSNVRDSEIEELPSTLQAHKQQKSFRHLDYKNMLGTWLTWDYSVTVKFISKSLSSEEYLYLRSGEEVEKLSTLQNPTQLKSLTLDLSSSEVKKMPSLQKFTQLQSLTIDLGGSRVEELPLLQELKQLQSLTLVIRNSQIEDLSSLQKLTQLQSLTLDLNDGQVEKLLSLLQKLKQLQSLTLDLSGSEVKKMPSLQNLVQLQSLTLVLRGSGVEELPLLQNLIQLKSLALDLRGSKIKDLLPLQTFTSLEKLDLNIDDEQRKSIKILPPKLTELAF